ncbi:MAG TPA: hypothetical protein VM163_04015 [bacterium]|nr:hypothetical protein [bacterium]
MQFWPDRLQSPGAKARRWFIVAIVLLPIAMTASGLKAYYLTESWVSFRPQTWGQIAHYPVVLQRHYGSQYYRPLAAMMQATEYKLFGTNTVLPRAINSAVYAMICLLVFLSLEALSRSFLVGALGSLIFAVMTCHVEPVFWMSQIQGLNSALFALLTFWLVGPGYRKSPSRTRIVLACITYAASFLFYESAIFMPLLLLIYELIWREEKGRRSLFRRLLKVNLPLWVMAAALLGLRALLLSTNVVINNYYFACVRELTFLQAIRRLPTILYTNVFPLKFSPLLCVVAVIILYVGFRANWRLTLFLVLWIAITPALAFPLAGVGHHRVLLCSFGVAGLMAYLLVLLPETILDRQRRSMLSAALDWVIAASVIYWVFALIRAGWTDFFAQGASSASTATTRYAIALVAAAAVATRCALRRRLSPRMSRAPLKFLIVGIVLLLVGAYMAGFLKLFAMFVDEASECARLPKAIVAAQPEVPDNTLVLIVFRDKSLIDRSSSCWNIRAPIRAEYGKRVDSLPFSDWVSSFQYKSIPAGMSVRAFAFDGQKALELPDLSARVLARQRSYLNLRHDVVHARFADSTSPGDQVRLPLDTDVGLIDRLDIVADRPLENVTAQLELISNNSHTLLTLPASFEATEATVRLEQNEKWLLAGHIDEVRVTVLDRGRSVPIREAQLVQSQGLISSSRLTLPPWSTQLGPALRSDTPLGKVPLMFPTEHPGRYFAFP